METPGARDDAWILDETLLEISPPDIEESSGDMVDSVEADTEVHKRHRLEELLYFDVWLWVRDSASVIDSYDDGDNASDMLLVMVDVDNDDGVAALALCRLARFVIVGDGSCVPELVDTVKVSVGEVKAPVAWLKRMDVDTRFWVETDRLCVSEPAVSTRLEELLVVSITDSESVDEETLVRPPGTQVELTV